MFKTILIKRKLRLATKIIYSGQFDLNLILNSINNSVTNQRKLAHAYVIIQAALFAKLHNQEKSVQTIIDEIDKYEKQMMDIESSQLVIDLLKAQTEELLLEAETKFNIDKLAPEFSLQGIIFTAEMNKGGPLTEKERNRFTKMSQDLAEIEEKIDAYQSPSLDSSSIAAVRECLGEIKDILSDRSQERISRLETLRDEIRKELIDNGIISPEHKFFPPFKTWYSKACNSDLDVNDAVVLYTEKLEQMYKECIAAHELGLQPPKGED